VLHAAARAAAEATRSSGAAAWTVGAAGAATLQVTHGATGNRDRAARALHAVAIAAIESGRPRIACPASDELLLTPEGAAELLAAAVLPIVAYGRAVGAIAVWRGHETDVRAFEPDDLEYLGALAGIVGLVLEQSRRSAELKDASGARASRRARRGGARDSQYSARWRRARARRR
jgi:GAF domain-containing protein